MITGIIIGVAIIVIFWVINHHLLAPIKRKKQLESRSSRVQDMYAMIDAYKKTSNGKQFGSSCMKEFFEEFYPEHHNLIMKLYDYAVKVDPNKCLYRFAKNIAILDDQQKWYVVHNQLSNSQDPTLITTKALIDATRAYIMRSYSIVEFDINNGYKNIDQTSYLLEFHEYTIQESISASISILNKNL